MPQRITIPIVGGHSKSRHATVNAQETLNLMTGIPGQGGKSQAILQSVPGLTNQGVAGDGACRSPNLVNWNGALYGVWGSKFVRISSTTGVTEIGTLTDTSSNRVRIARGRNYIALVDGIKGYSYDGTTFAEITDVDFPAKQSPAGVPTHIIYLDGFFIVNDANTDDFYISALEDPTSWNALDFEAAAVAPDNALAIAASTSILYIVGDETLQLYYNSGDPDFPYDIILNATQEVGIDAPQTIAESDAGVFYLATTPEGGRFVYQVIGQQGRKITNEDQDDELAGIDVSSAYGFIYNQAGKSFYVMQLNPNTPTWVYNITAGVWEKRAAADGLAWRIAGAGKLGSDNLGGSRSAATYFKFDLSVYRDDTTDIIRRRRSIVFHKTNQLIDYFELIIDCEPGVGLVSGQGSDPLLRLRYSDDGGNSWSSQLTASIGRQGEKKARAIFRRLGASRNRIFEIEYAEPTAFAIIAAYAHAQVLDD